MADWECNEGSGRFLNNLASPADSGLLQNHAALRGGALDLDGTDDYVNCGTRLLASLAGAFTVGVKVRWTSGTQVPAVGFNASDTSPSLAPVWTPGRSLAYLGGSNYRYFSHAPVDVDDGAWHDLHFVVTGPAQADIASSSLYADGRAQTVSTTVQTDVRGTITVCYIGRVRTLYWAGGLDRVRVWSRALLPSEVAWLAAEPYAMIADPSPRRYFIFKSEEAASTSWIGGGFW